MGISTIGRWVGKQAKFLVAVALAAVIGGVTTAGVLAAIPDADGTIHACYSNGVLGRVKIIDSASQTCGNNETAINWKQNGNPLLANPAGKNLSEAVMVYWDLRNTDFTGTNLNVAKLISSDLRGSNFSSATITSAVASNADFRGANLTNTNFQYSYLYEANLSGQTLTNTNLSSADLREADLTNTIFVNTNLSSTNLREQDLSGFDLSNAYLYGMIIPSGSLEEATFAQAQNLGGMNLEGTNLKNIDFKGANLAGAVLVNADLTGSNLTGITWVDPNFGTAICPDGTNASDHGDTCIGHL